MIRSWLHRLYEGRKLYVANPCDTDAHKVLKPLGRVLGWLGTSCPCCNGFRVLAAFAFGVVAPLFVLWLVAAGFVLSLAAEYSRGSDES